MYSRVVRAPSGKAACCGCGCCLPLAVPFVCEEVRAESCSRTAACTCAIQQMKHACSLCCLQSACLGMQAEQLAAVKPCVCSQQSSMTIAQTTATCAAVRSFLQGRACIVTTHSMASLARPSCLLSASAEGQAIPGQLHAEEFGGISSGWWKQLDSVAAEICPHMQPSLHTVGGLSHTCRRDMSTI